MSQDPPPPPTAGRRRDTAEAERLLAGMTAREPLPSGGCLRAVLWGVIAVAGLFTAAFITVVVYISISLKHPDPYAPEGPGADRVERSADAAAERLAAAVADGELSDQEINDSAGPADVVSVSRYHATTHVLLRFTRSRPDPTTGAPRQTVDCFDYSVTPGYDVRHTATGYCPTATPSATSTGGVTPTAQAPTP